MAKRKYVRIPIESILGNPAMVDGRLVSLGDYLKTLNVREEYTKQHPDDGMGRELNPNASFRDLFDCLRNGEDIYELIGADDSLIREELFKLLAKACRTDYYFVYYLWLNQ